MTIRHDEQVISRITISRLAFYLRTLNQIATHGTGIVSSRTLADHLGISAAQVRKDLSSFGEFGKQGTGYEIESLRAELLRILRVDCVWEVALIGAGDLGRALAGYGGFRQRGFCITAIFDNSPHQVGRRLHGVQIQDTQQMEAVIRRRAIQIAILAVPAEQAQSVAEVLVAAGVRAILNYAPVMLQLPAEIQVQNIDPVLHLQQMTFHLQPEPKPITRHHSIPLVRRMPHRSSAAMAKEAAG